MKCQGAFSKECSRRFERGERFWKVKDGFQNVKGIIWEGNAEEKYLVLK